MFIVMGVTLFTSRIILNALGVNDFGVYNVVGGMVALFGLISASLSASISRFITFELGTGNIKKLKQIFFTAVSIQLRMSILVFLIGGIIGFWFLNWKMNIADSRIVAANWVLFFSLLTLILNLVSVPYNAEIIAHEKMSAFAYVGIIEVCLKLGVAYSVYLFSDDKLIFYAFLIFLVSLIIRLIYGIYCTKNFEECKGKVKYDKRIFKDMSGFAGWTFIGTSSAAIQRQGSNILLNIFYNTALNASYAIGQQVNGAITNFSINFLIALKPQITKSYSSGDNSRLLFLIYFGSKLSFFLLWIIGLIVLIHTDYILHIWLKDVPEYTAIFVKLFILFSLCEVLSDPMITAQAATGKIRNYQICVGGFRLLDIPLAYLLLKLNMPPYAVVYSSILISVGMLILRLLFLKSDINLNINRFLVEVVLRVILVGVSSYFLTSYIVNLLPETFLFFVLKALISIMVTILCIFIMGCNQKEKKIITKRVKMFCNNKFNSFG